MLAEKFDLKYYETTTAVFIVPPEAHLLDVSGPAHIFYEAADYGAPIVSKFVTPLPNHTEEKSSSGLTISKLEGFTKIKLKRGDIVFIPGLDKKFLLDAGFHQRIQPFLKWLVTQHENGATICSVCTGAFLLAKSGLLDNRECTTHWKYHALFRKAFPKTRLLNNRLFVGYEEIYSSAGVSSGIDLGLYLLEKKYGTRFASAIAREVVVYLRRGESDPQLSVFMQYRNHIDDRIHSVQQWLSNNIGKKHTMEELGDIASTSARHLARLFKDTTGITIGQYVEKLRIEQAVQMKKDHSKTTEIAKAVGLRSTNQLRSLLRKYQEQGVRSKE